jgi:hypothetical protein
MTEGKSPQVFLFDQYRLCSGCLRGHWGDFWTSVDWQPKSPGGGRWVMSPVKGLSITGLESESAARGLPNSRTSARHQGGNFSVATCNLQLASDFLESSESERN